MSFFNQFGINIQYLVFYTIDFFIILYVLQKFLFKKIFRILDEREKKIVESLEYADAIKKTKQEMDERYKEAMHKTQREVQDMIREAKIQAEKLRQDILLNAEDEAKVFIKKAEEEIQNNHDKMYASLKKELLDIVLFTTKKVLRENMTKEIEANITKDTIKYIKDIGPNKNEK
jgi:F-type H+-transporting ATPase subunit b